MLVSKSHAVLVRLHMHCKGTRCMLAKGVLHAACGLSKIEISNSFALGGFCLLSLGVDAPLKDPKQNSSPCRGISCVLALPLRIQVL